MSDKFTGLDISWVKDGEIVFGCELDKYVREDYKNLSFKDFATRYLEPSFAQIFASLDEQGQ
jgi:hypothetical protein